MAGSTGPWSCLGWALEGMLPFRLVAKLLSIDLVIRSGAAKQKLEISRQGMTPNAGFIPAPSVSLTKTTRELGLPPVRTRLPQQFAIAVKKSTPNCVGLEICKRSHVDRNSEAGLVSPACHDRLMFTSPARDSPVRVAIPGLRIQTFPPARLRPSRLAGKRRIPGPLETSVVPQRPLWSR